ncbi:hypothetical protein ACOZ38_30065 [Sphaerisporangium viridialbum]|uniref:hypothetical protein n=1 Tax=Sphaerisporangium viridialbum TaxID=46189 RepID=UPI003C735ED2
MRHDKGSAGGMEELLTDFTSLTAAFAWRVYGIGGRRARVRLPAETDARIDAGDSPAGGPG